MSGFIKLHRGWHDSTQFSNEPYCERAAWCWLLTNAAWKETAQRNHKGEVVTVARGQFHTSLRAISSEWKWSIKRVRTFIKVLEKCGSIGTVGAQGGTIITICKYDEYQSNGHAGGTVEGTQGARSGHIKEEGEEREEHKNEAKASNARKRANAFPCPDGVDPIDWEGLKANRKAKRAALTEGAYRQITGKLDRWHRAGWPPGPVVAYAVERGWTTVFETDEMKGQTNGTANRAGTQQRDGRSSLARAIDEGLDWLDGTQARVS
jgi:hypothetical protein